MHSKEEAEEKQTIGAVGLDSLLLSAGYVTTKDLNNLINSFYHAVFTDYYGSKLEVAANGRSAFVVLKPVEGGKDSNLIFALRRAYKPSTDAYSRIELSLIVSTIPNGNYPQYKFADDAKEMLNLISSSINRNGELIGMPVSEETTGSITYCRLRSISLTCDIYKDHS